MDYKYNSYRGVTKTRLDISYFKICKFRENAFREVSLSRPKKQRMERIGDEPCLTDAAPSAILHRAGREVKRWPLAPSGQGLPRVPHRWTHGQPPIFQPVGLIFLVPPSGSATYFARLHRLSI